MTCVAFLSDSGDDLTSYLKSYREIRHLPDQSYTWTRFLQRVSPEALLERLSSYSIFARGLPPTQKLQNPNFVAVFEAVLCADVVKEDEFTDTGMKDAISQCFCGGWLPWIKLLDRTVSGTVSCQHFWHLMRGSIHSSEREYSIFR